MTLERIDPATAELVELEQHLERYRFAAEHTLIGETVLDAACGTGYGRALFESWAEWIGVDREVDTDVISADLTTWQGWHNLEPYDVFVGLETIEHLRDPWNYVEMAKAATRAIVISTPIIPTVGMNQYHVRDFTPAQIVGMFDDAAWQLESYREQLGIYGLFAWRRVA